MAHNIWSQRFYSRGTKPVWHSIDLLKSLMLSDRDRPRTATDILALAAVPKVELKALKYTYAGKVYTSDQQVIVRHETKDDPQHRVFGTVATGYELIHYTQAADIWDSLKLPVETLGFLGRGERMFISGVLPSFDVRGDEIANYLILDNPLTGRDSAGGYVSNVRVVCQNTLHAAVGNASSSFRLWHTTGAKKRLQKWLTDTYQNALAALPIMQEAYGVLAATKLSRPEFASVTGLVYPLPKRPQQDKPRKTAWKDVLAAWEYQNEFIQRMRDESMRLFEGAGTGFRREIGHTAWWGLNAIAEVETFRRGTTDSMASNVVVGDRARTIKRAFSHLMQTAKSGS